MTWHSGQGPADGNQSENAAVSMQSVCYAIVGCNFVPYMGECSYPYGAAAASAASGHGHGDCGHGQMKMPANAKDEVATCKCSVDYSPAKFYATGNKRRVVGRSIGAAA